MWLLLSSELGPTLIDSRKDVYDRWTSLKTYSILVLLAAERTNKNLCINIERLCQVNTLTDALETTKSFAGAQRRVIVSVIIPLFMSYSETDLC